MHRISSYGRSVPFIGYRCCYGEALLPWRYHGEFYYPLILVKISRIPNSDLVQRRLLCVAHLIIQSSQIDIKALYPKIMVWLVDIKYKGGKKNNENAIGSTTAYADLENIITVPLAVRSGPCILCFSLVSQTKKKKTVLVLLGFGCGCISFLFSCLGSPAHACSAWVQ